MISAQVLTPWEEVPYAETMCKQPVLKYAEFPGLLKIVDATGQPAENVIPDPNLLAVDVVASDQSVLDAIDADARFEVLYG